MNNFYIIAIAFPTKNTLRHALALDTSDYALSFNGKHNSHSRGFLGGHRWQKNKNCVLHNVRINKVRCTVGLIF